MSIWISFVFVCFFFFFKQKTAYEMRISDWSSDVCSSDLRPRSQRSDDAAIHAAGHGYDDSPGVNRPFKLEIGCHDAGPYKQCRSCDPVFQFNKLLTTDKQHLTGWFIGLYPIPAHVRLMEKIYPHRPVERR